MSHTSRGEVVGSGKDVGECKTVELKLWGVTVSCLLDTGSQVSTISEGFFREHLALEGEDVHLVA